MASTIILSDNGASSGSAGLKTTGGNDGVLILQTTTSGGTATNAIYVDNTQNVLLGGTSTIAKFAVANNTNDGTYNVKIYSVMGTSTTYLDSDAANLWGSGLGEFQIQNGTATRPAMLSLGGSVNTDEGMGVINFFRSGNDDLYRARVQIAGVVGSTGTAGRHGGYLVIRIAADGQTDPAQVARFNPSGTVILKGADASATGTGITFPATQSASTDANTLDDYEEGTWTPVITSDGTAPTGASITTNFAKYTKIGNLVTVTSAFNVASKGTGGTGYFYISGLPFSANYASSLVPFTVNIESLSAAKTNPIGLIPSNTTSAYAYAPNGSTTGMTPVTWAELSVGSWVRIVATYHTT